jgi:hypothetical protein
VKALFRGLLLLALCATAIPTRAFAQAYVDTPNTLSLTLSTAYAKGAGAYAPQNKWGATFMNGSAPYFEPLHYKDIDKFDLFSEKLALEYSTPLPGLAVFGSMPMMKFNFNTPNFDAHIGTSCATPYGGEGQGFSTGCKIPNNAFALQDLTFGVRYMLPVQPLDITVTPRLGVSLPMSDYPIISRTAIGTGLKTLQFGLDVSRDFGPILPNGFVALGYTYAYSEHISAAVPSALRDTVKTLPDKYGRPNRSLFSGFLGYHVMPELAVQAGITGAITHNGMLWGELEPIVANLAYTGLLYRYHDAISKARIINANVAVSYQAFDQLGLYLTGFRSLAGNSAVALTGFEFGLSTSFLLGGGDV